MEAPADSENLDYGHKKLWAGDRDCWCRSEPDPTAAGGDKVGTVWYCRDKMVRSFFQTGLFLEERAQ